MSRVHKRILKIIFYSPEVNRSIVSFFDTGRSESEYSCGSISVQVLSPIVIVLVDELAEVRLCGFALAFDRPAKARAFDFNA